MQEKVDTSGSALHPMGTASGGWICLLVAAPSSVRLVDWRSARDIDREEYSARDKLMLPRMTTMRQDYALVPAGPSFMQAIENNDGSWEDLERTGAGSMEVLRGAKWTHKVTQHSWDQVALSLTRDSHSTAASDEQCGNDLYGSAYDTMTKWWRCFNLTEAPVDLNAAVFQGTTFRICNEVYLGRKRFIAAPTHVDLPRPGTRLWLELTFVISRCRSIYKWKHHGLAQV